MVRQLIFGVIAIYPLMTIQQMGATKCKLPPIDNTCPKTDIDFIGNDMRRIFDISDWQTCAKKCSEESGCSFWTWVTPDYTDTTLRLSCFLKNGDGGRRPLEGVISGNVSCQEDDSDNRRLRSLYLNKWKNVYTNCIQNPECEGCSNYIREQLPALLQENIIKEGEIGVNSGSLKQAGLNHGLQKARAQTLTLRKVGDIKTIRTNNEMVTINGTVNGKVGTERSFAGRRERPTGLYAGPGDLVTITFPKELVGKVAISIGNFFGKNELNGFKLSFPVRTTICKIGSPYGGLINLIMKSKDSYTGVFTVNITNAIKAPTFIYNVTTNQEWKEMRNYSPKWSVLVVPGQLQIYVQTLKIKDITDMEATMSRIKLTMDALEDMLGLPKGSRPGAELLYFEPGMGGRGGYHVGYCMSSISVVSDILYTEDKDSKDTYYDDFFKESGTNGLILHEFGHGYCYLALPEAGGHWYVGTVSSYIRNLRGAYRGVTLHENMFLKDLDFDLLYWMVGHALYSRGKPCGQAKFNDKQLATNTYGNCYKWLNWIPERAIGWHVWKDVNSLIGKPTKHYKKYDWDRMIDAYCQATKHNMLPVFSLYNIKPSDQAITKYCQELPEHDIITQWLDIVKCVNQSMSNANKDIRDCAKMPRFPQHKGLCVISGVCHNDETNNGYQTMMNEKFDLYGSNGKWKKNTTENEKNCFDRATDFMLDCKNNIGQPITATYYRKKQGNEFNYDKVNFTLPRSDCSSTEGCPLAKNSLVTILPELKMEFKVSFEFRATAWQSGWQNVIHFTEGDNCCNAGHRIPGFWVSNSGQLHPCFAVGDNGNYCTLTTKEYSLNTWHSVEISQTLKNGKYMYRVVVDGEDVIASAENTKPRTYSNVKVYAADNWYNPPQGSIRNLLVNPRGGETGEK